MQQLVTDDAKLQHQMTNPLPSLAVPYTSPLLTILTPIPLGILQSGRL
jgi:hypothetical protein